MTQNSNNINQGKDNGSVELKRVTTALDILIQMDLEVKQSKEVKDGRYDKNSTTNSKSIDASQSEV